MQLTVTSWNINSVRLRIGMVGEFLTRYAPDILCLQETKTPDEQFPAKAFHQLGYVHQAFIGQKGYNGVAIVSKLPFSEKEAMSMCGRNDARHMTVTLDKAAGSAAGIAIHNFYIPAGGDIPDPAKNDKFAHKLAFLDEIGAWGVTKKPTDRPAILLGDLNIAPYEHDVWSHKQLLDVVSHTPIETTTLEKLRSELGWTDAARTLRPEPEKLYSWWSYRAQDWEASNRGRRLDHIWLSDALKPTLRDLSFLREARGWERPSDHVPVTVTLEL
ncbi:exodeoxyribonuclease III [Bosea sp. UNC402CLCol]|uniref:exodeoxyribonuclease III n=1 Tax=Bosea sp. UNC402CLCol TaxID=1510531 RepID=UPI000570C181|nr:exodeoxyribonuclease III [Bosea sp. UNC402CLCol]